MSARRCFDAAVAARVLRSEEICTNESVWLDAISEAVLAKPGPIHYVSAGTNKGFNVVHFLRRYANTTVLPSDWLREQSQFLHASTTVRKARGVDKYLSCGRCGGCKDDHTPPVGSREVNVHAFELVPENVAWLRWAFARFALRANVVHAAAGNFSGRMPVPSLGAVGFGFERATVSVADHEMVDGVESAGRPNRFSHFGRAVKLGEYFEEEELGFVHVVQIDCEGFDGLVVHGMAEPLRRGRVGVFQFEASNGANWRRAPAGNQTLGNLLRWLPAHYACFVEVRSACLVPIAPAHCGWIDGIEESQAHNVICALDGAYQEALWRVVGRCVEWPLEKVIGNSQDAR